ncbi:uncharacterized protein LOC122631958 isoform X2 [Vespula pensylvanica]|uniref:uncharacterized protein LOC122631958 isoform X2 n=1 Tax=Vespula pensylvanica TaxID=30213 RepID=UPI001CBA4200|nr:uncharacterized protein LOC122631958 isoform X2 [Vespula pensylvanica]
MWKTGTMKNAYPVVTAASSSLVDPVDSSISRDDISKDEIDNQTSPVIRLKLDKPLHWYWELTTTADALPVIQLLDKDGRLLVETTGKTAQRARGSFREGLTDHEKFPLSSRISRSTSVNSKRELIQSGNRNIDGFSNKFGPFDFGYKPRKSRSDASIKVVRDKRIKNKENDKEVVKRYSTGDFLRRQILDDLRTKSMFGKSPDEIAKERCRKVKAYLKSQSEIYSSSDHSINRDCTNEYERYFNDKLDKIESEEDRGSDENNRSNLYDLRNPLYSVKNDNEKYVDSDKLVKIRSFLREKLRESMEATRNEGNNDSTIKKRHSDRKNEEDSNNTRTYYRTRKVRSETNVINNSPGRKTRFEDRSDTNVPSFRFNDNDNTSNVVRNLPWISSNIKKNNYRRSKSDALLVGKSNEFVEQQRKYRSARRESTESRRRTYRKTKSDLHFDNPNTEKELDRIERSWRDYKERKKLEKLQREKTGLTEEKEEEEKDEEDTEEKEDNFTRNKTSSNDFKSELCVKRNCKVCQNLRNSLGSSKTNENIICPFETNNRSGRTIECCDRSIDFNSPSPSIIVSPDFGYNSIHKSAFKDYRELYARSNVKKSDTFKIIDGSEEQDDSYKEDDSNLIDDNQLPRRDNKSEMISLINKSNEDIARDYFKRVYELLKKRQEEARKVAEKRDVIGYDDSSSSNYVEEVRRRKHRRRKRDPPQGEELVTVTPSNGGQQDGWKVQHQQQQQQQQQRCQRGQLQTVNKRTRPSPPPPPPPPPLISCKVNAKDIGKYFDWPNKENTPGNAVNNNPIAKGAVSRKARIFLQKKDQEKEEVGEGWWGQEEEEEEEEEKVKKEEKKEEEEEEEEEKGESINEMGSNLSRHNGKGLTGRRTQSSGNLCEPPKGKFNGMGKILVPCSSSSQRERYKFCGSLPNHLDDKDVLDDDRRENNNIMSDTISGNLGGTLPHKKRSLGVHFSDGGPTGALDLVKHRSQDSLDENDPWRYQQSDLDLVRCRHGNFDSVRRNRSIDTMINDTNRRCYNHRETSTEERCQRNSDLDLVGTLPKRKQETRSGICKGIDGNSSMGSQFAVTNKFDVSSSDDDLLMRVLHKPDCELVKHRQQALNKCVDLKLSKLAGATGEPQDQGYASERSPEDEHPPSLPGQPFPSVTPESTFRVTLQKSSRGLGLSVSGGGTAGPVRVKRLFPLQPAALSNKLQPGDILLAANGIPLTGLTNYEALEVLRTTPNTVELVVCRLPGDTNVTPPGAPPPPPARREPPPPLRIPNPLPPLQIEPCGEFDIEMMKVGGSLGFTLRKADSSALGHYVRALVREPALSDGRIRPGDKIVAVDGAPLSPMSHEEAVALLRQCGPKVKLRLYRDLAQTPVSALSPTEPDHPLRPPRTCLRQEAVDMLCDLAARKLSPGTSSGSSCLQSPAASCSSPRRHRRLATRTPTADNDQEIPEKFHEGQTASVGSHAETSDSDQCSVRTQITNSQANTPISGTDIIIDPPSQYHVCESSDSPLRTPTRPSFLDLSAPQGKPHFQFCSGDSEEYPVETMLFSEKDSSCSFETDYHGKEIRGLSSDEQDNDLPSEPASMPPVLSSTSSTSTGGAFSYKNPAYQSANPACSVSIDAVSKNKVTHSSDQDIPGKILGTEDPAGSKGLLKWKGVMFAPSDDMNQCEKDVAKVDKDNLDSMISSEGQDEQGNEVFMVELTRGWNSRLGFSLKSEDNHTVISVVHPDSVAARDGRLKQGDVLLMVNDESVESMSTAEIIDLLRKIRGSIGITVMRKNKQENAT